MATTGSSGVMTEEEIIRKHQELKDEFSRKFKDYDALMEYDPPEGTPEQVRYNAEVRNLDDEIGSLRKQISEMEAQYRDILQKNTIYIDPFAEQSPPSKEPQYEISSTPERLLQVEMDHLLRLIDKTELIDPNLHHSLMQIAAFRNREQNIPYDDLKPWLDRAKDHINKLEGYDNLKNEVKETIDKIEHYYKEIAVQRAPVIQHEHPPKTPPPVIQQEQPPQRQNSSKKRKALDTLKRIRELTKPERLIAWRESRKEKQKPILSGLGADFTLKDDQSFLILSQHQLNKLTNLTLSKSDISNDIFEKNKDKIASIQGDNRYSELERFLGTEFKDTIKVKYIKAEMNYIEKLTEIVAFLEKSGTSEAVKEMLKNAKSSLTKHQKDLEIMKTDGTYFDNVIQTLTTSYIDKLNQSEQSQKLGQPPKDELHGAPSTEMPPGSPAPLTFTAPQTHVSETLQALNKATNCEWVINAKGEAQMKDPTTDRQRAKIILDKLSDNNITASVTQRFNSAPPTFQVCISPDELQKYKDSSTQKVIPTVAQQVPEPVAPLQPEQKTEFRLKLEEVLEHIKNVKSDNKKDEPALEALLDIQVLVGTTKNKGEVELNKELPSLINNALNKVKESSLNNKDQIISSLESLQAVRPDPKSRVSMRH